jgi:hypothetical protein
MLKGIKHRATVMVGSIKQGKDAATCLNPDFAISQSRFKELRDHIKGFVEEAQQILTILPKVFKSAGEFSALTQKCFETFPEEDRPLSQRLATLTNDMQLFVNNRAGPEAADAIVRPLRDLLRTLDELGNVAKEHHDSYLILEQNKSKLEGLAKEPEKNAGQVQIWSEKVTSRQQETENLEAEFIGRMQAVWENRFNVLNGPLRALLAVVVETGQALRTASDPVVECLGQDVLTREFPAAASPETKPKK